MLENSQLKDAKILVVDDTRENLDVLVKQLEGYRVSVALNGEEAVRMAEKNIPDLILLDVMMPGLNGFEACERIKKIDALKDVPVIFLSALCETDDKLKGFRAGGVDYITKPPKFEEVIARITTHLTIKKQRDMLEEMTARFEYMAKTDPLTKLSNRLAFLESARREFERTSSSADPFSILLADIDFFKKVNDTYGHGCGDSVLIKIADIIKNPVRRTDLVARWGGEEFIVLLPNTDVQGAIVTAERIRENVNSTEMIYEEQHIRVTLTIGLYTNDGSISLEESIRLADEALYKGKENGRNQVVVRDRDGCGTENAPSFAALRTKDKAYWM